MKKYILFAIVSILSVCAQAAVDSDSSFVTIQAGYGYKTSSLRVIDKITGAPINATFSNVSIQNNNPGIAVVDTTISIATIKVSRVSVGSGTAVISCHVTYVDPGDGLQKSEDKTIILFYTIEGAPHGTKLGLPYN